MVHAFLKNLDIENLLNGLADSAIVIDGKGKICFVNPSVLKLFGYSEQELLDQNIVMLMNAEDRKSHDRYVGKYLETGKSNIIGKGRSVTARRKDGQSIGVHLTVSHHKSQEQNSDYFVGIIRDLTVIERNSAELQAILAAIPTTIKLLDKDMVIQYVNHSHFADQNMSEFLGAKLTDQYTDFISRQAATEAFVSARETKQVTGYKLFHKNNNFDCKMSPLFVQEEFQGAVMIATHMDNLIRQKVELERLVAEKEVLVKEVFHRVRNNFQVISSLLSLQHDLCQSAEGQEAIASARTRIMALSAVHDLIYQEESGRPIPLDTYLDKIAQTIVNNNQSPNKKISLLQACVSKDSKVNHSEAVALGAILGELIMNSIKYAGGPGRPVNIFYGINNSNNEFTFCYADDGDFYKSLNANQTAKGNLGTKIIRGFADNISGTISYPLLGKLQPSCAECFRKDGCPDSFCFSLTFKRST